MKNSDPQLKGEAKKQDENTNIAEAVAPQSFNLSRFKGKSIVELSNNTELDVDVVDQRSGEAMKNKSNNQSTKATSQRKREKSDPHGNADAKKKKLNYQNTNIAEAMPQRFNLSRCKGKSAVELSNNTSEHMDIVDQNTSIAEAMPQTFNHSRCKDQATGVHFQEEIIMEFLIRLPVRSLHRFKCVSKSWNALISDPYFKKKHLSHAKSDRNFQKILVAKFWMHDIELHEFYSSTLSSSLRLVQDEQKLDFPSSSWKPHYCHMLCCCDGLLLLSVTETIYNKGREMSEEHLVLWNPSTRESIEIPLPSFQLEWCVFGIGYDITTDDYKILVVDLDKGYHSEVRCEILALTSGSWRSSKCPTGIHSVRGFIDCGMDSLALVQGAVHWFGFKQYNHAYTIVSFDISNEVYGEIPLLEGMCYILFERRKRGEHIDQGVSTLGGMLCFYSTYNDKVEPSFKLWGMKEYGVKESWTVLFMIQDSNLHSVRPQYRYADDEVLLCCRNLMRCNSIYITSRGPFGGGLWPSGDIFKLGIVYTESLISPKLLP